MNAESRTNNKRTKQWLWIGLGAMMILLRVIFGQNPVVIETWYSRTIFPIIRQLIDHTIAFLPFPAILLFIVFVIYKLATGIKAWRRPGLRLPQKLLNALMGLSAFFGGLVFFFLLLWGFNYARIPIEEQLQLDLEPLTYQELRQELAKETDMLIRLRESIVGEDSAALAAKHLPKNLEPELRELVEQTMESLGYPKRGRVQARMLQPKGILLRISTSGFYFPWTGEAHIDAGLHPIQLPAVIAHELTHGYGITDEGTCNFIAYLACLSAKDPFIRYSGHFSYWRYLRGSVSRQNPEAFAEYKANLHAGLSTDVEAVKKQMDKYPDILPTIRNLTYETYLKAQGISEGIANYRRIVLLVHAWQSKGLHL